MLLGVFGALKKLLYPLRWCSEHLCRLHRRPHSQSDLRTGLFTHTTGHAEAVEITFDPKKISFEQLLDKFWEIHDPTTPNRQGPDIGSNYRSAIFYHSDEQKKQAEESRNKAKTKLERPIVTEITAAGPFYKAEEYHQKYYHKHDIASISCPIYNNLQGKPHS